MSGRLRTVLLQQGELARRTTRYGCRPNTCPRYTGRRFRDAVGRCRCSCNQALRPDQQRYWARDQRRRITSLAKPKAQSNHNIVYVAGTEMCIQCSSLCVSALKDTGLRKDVFCSTTDCSLIIREIVPYRAEEVKGFDRHTRRVTICIQTNMRVTCRGRRRLKLLPCRVARDKVTADLTLIYLLRYFSSCRRECRGRSTDASWTPSPWTPALRIPDDGWNAPGNDGTEPRGSGS